MDRQICPSGYRLASIGEPRDAKGALRTDSSGKHVRAIYTPLNPTFI